MARARERNSTTLSIGLALGIGACVSVVGCASRPSAGFYPVQRKGYVEMMPYQNDETEVVILDERGWPRGVKFYRMKKER